MSPLRLGAFALLLLTIVGLVGGLVAYGEAGQRLSTSLKSSIATWVWAWSRLAE